MAKAILPSVFCESCRLLLTSLLLSLSLAPALTAQNLGTVTATDVQADSVNTNKLKLATGAAAGHVLQSDANGNASWVSPLALPDDNWIISGNNQHSAVSGNVGIGTSSPTTKLDVAGTALDLATFRRTNDDSGQILVSADDAVSFLGVDGTFFGGGTIYEGVVGTLTNHDFLIKTNSIPRMHIAKNGNVAVANDLTVYDNLGVGTDAPVALFHVSHPDGNVEIARFESNGGFGQIFVTNGLGQTSSFGVSDAGAFGFVGTQSSNSFRIRTGAVDRITIASGGNVTVAQNFSVSGTKSFLIDHPLDPANKKLYHACMESPAPLNVYSGTAVLDAGGKAQVQLPGYFEALNKDFRYQLTCVGGFAPVFISKKVAGNSFEIAGGTPGLEVSWQVTGERNDPYCRDHPYQPVQEKTDEERGRYFYPAGYGQPEEMRVGGGEIGN